jgi:hypothetical protein
MRLLALGSLEKHTEVHSLSRILSVMASEAEKLFTTSPHIHMSKIAPTKPRFLVLTPLELMEFA